MVYSKLPGAVIKFLLRRVQFLRFNLGMKFSPMPAFLIPQIFPRFTIARLPAIFFYARQ
jgi:hypothetical protein